MNGSAQNVGLRKKRSHATPAVAPVTRAIRAALAVSATALALSVPVVGLAAGPCSYDTASNTHACIGGFNQSIFSQTSLAVADANLVPPVDLTVVPGDQLPSSVTADAAGIDAVWASDFSIFTDAGTSIDTSSAVGAMDVGSVDDVTLVDGGDAFADATRIHDAITAHAFSLSGDISTDNHLDGTLALGYGTLEIGDEGVINADSINDGANGIVATAVNNLTIDNGSDISVSGYGNVFGLDVVDAYTARLNNSADISAEAGVGAGYFGTGAYATAARVNSMDAIVCNYGGISATATADGYYARARGVDSFGYAVGSTVYNASTGDIQASAQADGGRARAIGVYSFGYSTASTVDNAGDIHASAQAHGGAAYATAINSVAYGYSGGLDASLTNSGALSADADADFAYAITIFNIATGRYGNAYVTNADEGKIYAEANGDFTTATAVINQATRYGSAATSNAGGIYATANGTSGGASFGISNYSQGYDAAVDNSGSISATSTSAGIALATGVENESVFNTATFYNSGSISVSADSGTGMAAAWGVTNASEQVSSISNEVDGDIDVVAHSQDGYALAVGAYALGGLATTLTNYGSISARSSSVNGDATAYAAVVNGGYAGIGLLINGGDLNANASSTAGDAIATGAFVYGDVATIFNDGTSTATASAGGEATATGLGVYGGFSAIYSYGDVTATASSSTADGIATAIGADTFGYTGSSVYNAADMVANASADGGVASATGASSVGIFISYATNVATISAEATGAQTTATGVYNASAFDAITYNEGSISAVAEGTVAAYGEYEAMAFGAYNLAVYYSSIIDNNGSITASASATTDISGTDGFLVAKALGAVALSMYGYGETVIANSGSIIASAETSQGYAGTWGAVITSGLYGTAAIENDGLIATYSHTDIGSADTIGAYVSTIAGTSSVVNHGDIIANARAERGIVNVSVNYAAATGVQVFSIPYGGGEVTVDNYGNIEAHASVLGGIGYAYGVQAYGMHTSINNAAGADIIATVDAELFGGAFAMGVEAGGMYSIDIVNDGRIIAYGHANAHSEGENGFYGAAGAIGVYASTGPQGDAMVVNNGDVTALAIAENSVRWAQGGAGATGINAYAMHDATVVNTSNISAIADAEFGNTGAYGVIAHGKYSSHITNEAGASIVASASVGSLAGDQYAGRAVSFGTQIFRGGMDHAVTYNAGSIVSHATVTPDGTETPIGSIATAFGSSTGYNSAIDRGTVTNLGSIEAAASADFGYATAYGVFLRSGYDSVITNAGDIRASASATGGNAFAVGSYVFSLHETVTFNCDPTGYYCDWANPVVDVDGGESLLDNSGDIITMVSAAGGTGYGYGAVLLSAYGASITNAGQISAVTDADDALAIGGLANSFYGDALLQNSGVISAVATGDIANATGASVIGSYGNAGNGYLAAVVDNQGDILAMANGGTATATGLDTIGRYDDGIRIDNAGTIMAAAYGGDATAIAVSMDSHGSNVLTNTGTIGAFGDGTRIAVSSAGATTSIVNHGSLIGAVVTGDFDDSLDNAAGALWHAVGDSDFGAGDDHIVNHGTIFMDDAAIRLGGYVNGNTFDNFGTLAVSGAGNVLDMGNPFPVNNNGVISFVDGAADDMLTIVGDFAGQGAIHVDVSGLNRSSDRLYIDGDVIESTTQTLNVNLVDLLLPRAANTDISLVQVSGDSTAANFVLGNVVHGANGFLTMDFSLNASVDANNAADDVFSLGVAVTGLNDMGSVAAALAPGAQSLVNAQVGTWRQRMGVVPASGDSVLAPWVRMFSDSGDVNAQHSSNFGPGGTYGFDQSNSGWELGLDTRPSEHLAVGVLFGDSEGSQHLTGGAGSDRLDGRTFGLYGTWLANGFYLDVSQRWTGIDARLSSAAGTQKTKASADAFNVEAGFTAWTVGNIHVVPQAQYTHTKVGDVSALYGSQSTFVDDGGVSSRGRLGVALDTTFEGAGFTWTPYGSLNAVREFDGEYNYSVNGGLLGTTSTEGTSAMVELGMGARKGKLSVTGGVNWIDGGALESVSGGQLTMRYSF